MSKCKCTVFGLELQVFVLSFVDFCQYQANHNMAQIGKPLLAVFREKKRRRSRTKALFLGGGERKTKHSTNRLLQSYGLLSFVLLSITKPRAFLRLRDGTSSWPKTYE